LEGFGAAKTSVGRWFHAGGEWHLHEARKQAGSTG
jgi:hypothetical protein